MGTRMDYKLARVSYKKNSTMDVEVRFYQGDFLSEAELKNLYARRGDVWDEVDQASTVFPVYVRESKIVKRPLNHFTLLNGVSSRLEKDGNTVILTVNRTLTDKQLRIMLNTVLLKDTTREAIDEQKITR